jgi:hypothetical protein
MVSAEQQDSLGNQGSHEGGSMSIEAMRAALEDALNIFCPEGGQQHLAPKWEARARAALAQRADEPATKHSATFRRLWDESPVTEPAQSLTMQMQQMCSDWGVYWRASDAHGVSLSHEQALDLLRFALGVEVEIKDAPQREDEPVARLLHWIGPAPRPGADSIARTFQEYPVGADGSRAYWSEGANLYTAAPAAPATQRADEPVAETTDGLQLIEVLEKRYGLSFLGSEKRLMHFARDWLFLTTPEPAPAAPAYVPLSESEVDDLARTMVEGNKSVNWLARAIESLVVARMRGEGK